MSRSISNEQTSPIRRTRFAYALATGLGAGLVPIAPGTLGALEGVAIYIGIRVLNSERSTSLFVLTIINIVLFGLGVWASDRTCEKTGIKDPGVIVIDEVSGQLISLLPLGLLPSFSIAGIAIGFVLFRLFDIFKPYPIRQLERLRGGLGVMADDALAGVYAAILVWVCVQFKVL
jgi:phosphatidylglycerophosphatase A